MRVLFLSANVGAGHQSAANAVCAALREIDPSARTHVVDSYKYAALVVSRVVSDGYLQMVKTIPQMYRYIYARAERATEVGPFRMWAHQFTASNLRRLIARERPDLVVCTHAFPCGAMAEYKRAYDDAPPIVAIVTDFAVHAFWVHDNIDAYAVASQAVGDALVARGVRRERIVPSGIPVLPQFAPGEESRERLRERLSLPQDRRLVLLMGGGLGIGPLSRMLAALESIGGDIGAVVIAGRDARVERCVWAAATATSYPVRVLRFVENVYDYMHACDAFVTKPGGLSTAEGLAAGIPMVLCKPLPGQEERNARYLAEAGAAVRARKLDDLPAAVASLLPGGERRERTMAGAAQLARPNAARDVAELIAARIGSVREIVA